MSFEQLMNSYAARQQMGELESENEQYNLVVNDQIKIACFLANGRFYVYSIIAKLPEENSKREELLTRLLKKNLALVAYERVSLCIDPDKNALALYASAPAKSLSVDVIEQTIAALANNYELFVQWLDQSAPSPGSAMMFMP